MLAKRLPKLNVTRNPNTNFVICSFLQDEWWIVWKDYPWCKYSVKLKKLLAGEKQAFSCVSWLHPWLAPICIFCSNFSPASLMSQIYSLGFWVICLVWLLSLWGSKCFSFILFEGQMHQASQWLVGSLPLTLSTDRLLQQFSVIAGTE